MSWKTIENYSRYQISEKGQVYNTQTNKIMTQNDNGGGYMQVYLRSDDGQRKRLYVHRLVYQAHVGAIPKGYEINHKDENKKNNNLSNLEAITHLENMRYGTRLKRLSKSRRRTVGQYTPSGKLVCVWESMTEANEWGFGMGHVSSCCTGKQRLYQGYIWKYIAS